MEHVFLLLLLGSIIFTACLWIWNRRHRKLLMLVRALTELVSGMSCYIKHLYALSDILARSQSFVHQQIYSSLRTMDPRNLTLVSSPKDSKEYLLGMKETLMNEYQKSREALVAMINREPGMEEKKYLQELLDGLDGPFNLLSTLDKDSSVEYAESIQKDIDSSMQKLFEKISGRRAE